MPDHAAMRFTIVFHDRWYFPDEEPDRWNKIKDEIEKAANKIIVQNGFAADQYEILPCGY